MVVGSCASVAVLGAFFSFFFLLWFAVDFLKRSSLLIRPLLCILGAVVFVILQESDWLGGWDGGNGGDRVCVRVGRLVENWLFGSRRLHVTCFFHFPLLLYFSFSFFFFSLFFCCCGLLLP